MIYPFVKIGTYGGDIHIKKGTIIHSFSVLYGYKGIIIGERCGIATSTIIVGGNHKFDNIEKSIWEQGFDGKGIFIDDEVWIGSGSRILDGSKIEKGSIIGAGSIVTKFVPKNGIVYGEAAKVKYFRNKI
ncbi:MAG: acyltransferase [Patescibacteria group bacterium]